MASPVADFIADNTTPLTSQIVSFTDLSTNIPTSWYRDFWDGYTSVLQNPTHVYANPWVYSVILIATNADGSDAETKTNYISAAVGNPITFYNGYQIDDSQIGCGKIIAVDCDNLHYYVNPCDLIEACVAQLPSQLSKQCIVDFFNTTIDTIPAGYVLRVNGSHCLEAVPLSINDTDELVGISATDTPGYLWNKIVWCSNGGRDITVTPIGPMGNQQLRICIDPPAHVKEFPGDPICDWAYLRGNDDGTLYRDCGWGGNDSYRAVRYTTSDITPLLSTNIYKSYFFTNSLDRWGQQLSTAGNMDVFEGNPDMDWTGSYEWMIRVPKNWMYEIRMKGEAVINNWVSRVRLFLGIPASTNPKILIDSKRGPEVAFAWSFQNFPYQSNAGTDGIESMTATFNGQRLVYLEAGQYIAMWCKIDSRYCDGVTPAVTWKHTVYELYDCDPGQSVAEVSYTWPGLSFWIKRYSPHKF